DCIQEILQNSFKTLLKGGPFLSEGSPKNFSEDEVKLLPNNFVDVKPRKKGRVNDQELLKT
ncbi:MAG: hypothetical protein Q8P08_01570, partial [bacterium]|nr:hypothetical protein [bacterium]